MPPHSTVDQPTPPHHPSMNLPPHPNGLTAPPLVRPPLPPQQPGQSNLDVQQPTWDTHLNNARHPEPSNNVGSFPITAPNVPRSSVQNVNSPSHPSLVDGQIPSWDNWFIPPVPGRSSHPSSTTQNAQVSSACPTCTTHPTPGPFQFGGGRPAPTVQDLTAPSAAAPSSFSSFPNPTASHCAPPAPEALLFLPGVANAGPTTANTYRRRSKRARPRRERDVPFVRVEDRIEWVSRDVMKMTLWFNWSPDAETEAHDDWE